MSGRMTVEERFWAKVDKSGDCWEWTGALTDGYGAVKIGGRRKRAHRVAYALLVGPIPDGLTLDHLCRNRLRGHEYTPDNTYVSKTHPRTCRTCKRADRAGRRARLRAERAKP